MLISIEQLMVEVYLGVHDSEQHRLRNIPVDVQFEYETAGVDELSAAIDYRAIRDRVLEATQGRRFRLIEALAKTILDAVKGDSRILRVAVVVREPRALRVARSVSVLADWCRPQDPKTICLIDGLRSASVFRSKLPARRARWPYDFHQFERVLPQGSFYPDSRTGNIPRTLLHKYIASMQVGSLKVKTSSRALGQFFRKYAR
jgi:FolB domain-containing protein